MNAIETTATFEGQEHLRLARPLPDAVSGHRVRVIVLFEDTPVENPRKGNFRAAIGSYYRDFPNKVVRSSKEWLAEIREGEID